MVSRTLLSRTAKGLVASILLAGLLPSAGFAQAAAPKKELSDKVSSGLTKLSELMEAKNFDAALAIINPLIPTSAPNSYDLALLSQIKAQLLLQKSDFAGAIKPLEVAYGLGQTYGYFDNRQLLELSYYLAQLYYQEGSNAKDREVQKANLDKAYGFISSYLKESETVNPEAQAFAASLLYTRAIVDPDNVDKKLLGEAQAQAQEGLYSDLKPKDNFYVLILAALQQFGKNEEAAELLELLVSQHPENKQYWQQLAASYLNLAAEAEGKSDTKRVRQWNIRTIVTIERAQELGIMNEPKDNFNLVGLYFNIERFDDAIRLLEKGLSDGSIEGSQRNWELLASSYQQVNKELKAVEVLKQASALFPEAGSLEFQIANIYYSIDKIKEAYTHGLKAVEKGNLSNLPQVQMFVAYLAYELQDYDVALQQAEAAAGANSDPNSSANGLLKAIKEAIAERDASRKANESK